MFLCRKGGCGKTLLSYCDIRRSQCYEPLGKELASILFEDFRYLIHSRFGGTVFALVMQPTFPDVENARRFDHLKTKIATVINCDGDKLRW